MFTTLNHNPRRSFDYAEAITNTRRALWGCPQIVDT